MLGFHQNRCALQDQRRELSKLRNSLLVENLLKEPFSILFHEVEKIFPSHEWILNSVGSLQTQREGHSRAMPAELAQSSVSWVSTGTPVIESSLLSPVLRTYLSRTGVTMGT